MQEIRDIETMRGILNGPNFPYRAAFDLNTRKIYYFIEKNWLNGPRYKEISTKGMYDYIYREYHLDKSKNQVFYEYDPVFINRNPEYVYRNMMTIDNDE